MNIELSKEAQDRLVGTIQQYFQENMDEEIGDLKAFLLISFLMKKLGPEVYNQAVSDVQAVMTERVEELDSVCYASEDDFGPKNK